MLHKGFENFINAMAIMWVSDDTFRDISNSLEIDPDNWPECAAKGLVTEYERLWPQAGHLKARRALAPSASALLEKSDTDLIPNDINKLRAAYDSYEFLQKAMLVGVEISERPENAFEIFSKLRTTKQSSEIYDMASISKEHFERLCESVTKGKLVKHIPEWDLLSNLIGGFNPGRLGMILAESGFGKSNFCLNLALSAQKEMKVVYFNMEMLIEDMMDRTHVIMTEVPWADLKNGAVPVYNNYLVQGNLMMTNGVDKSLDQIRLITKRLNQEKHVDFVVVDYDQKILLKTDSKTPEWMALRDAFISLEALAKEVGCYVLVAAQSSNEDGKVSGSLRSKFPCSTVMFFHDHEIHGPIISIKKNRFESTKQYLKVDYSPHKSTVKEKELIHEYPDKSVDSPKRTKRTIPPTNPVLSHPYRDT